jgi:hypothetical protein
VILFEMLVRRSEVAPGNSRGEARCPADDGGPARQ